MELKKLYKDIEIKERHWRIKKFDARTGAFMAFKIAGMLAPILQNLDLSKIMKAEKLEDINLKDFNISDTISGLTNLTEDEFYLIQNKCLGVCYELLEGGEAKVLNKDGSFGVIGIEYDAEIVLALTAHAITFNVQGFFPGNPLTLINKGK